MKTDPALVQALLREDKIREAWILADRLGLSLSPAEFRRIRGADLTIDEGWELLLPARAREDESWLDQLQQRWTLVSEPIQHPRLAQELAGSTPGDVVLLPGWSQAAPAWAIRTPARFNAPSHPARGLVMRLGAERGRGWTALVVRRAPRSAARLPITTAAEAWEAAAAMEQREQERSPEMLPWGVRRCVAPWAAQEDERRKLQIVQV